MKIPGETYQMHARMARFCLSRMPLWLSIVAALASCHHWGRAVYETKCKEDMGVIADLAFALWLETGKIEKQDQRLMDDLIAAGSHPKTDLFTLHKIKVRNGMAVDPLGHPYQIRYSGGVVTLWSWGRNGIDEGGKGDDIRISKRECPDSSGRPGSTR